MAAFGTLAMKAARLATEDEAYDPEFVGVMRTKSEDTMLGVGCAAFAPRLSAFRQSCTAPANRDPITHFAARRHGASHTAKQFMPASQASR